METWDRYLVRVVNVLDRRVRQGVTNCGCEAMTTRDRGALVYTCAPCMEVAHWNLQHYENPHTDQLSLSNWGMY